MTHDIIIFLLGLVLIIGGGNYLTDGAAAIAARFRISSLVIGVTVVALGSSTPDLVVCLLSSISDKTGLALGDVVGANIFDLLLVVGIVAIIHPISISRDMRRKDIPMVVLSSLALFFCGDDQLFDKSSADIISRTDGLMLLGFFVIFMLYTLSNARCEDRLTSATPASTATASKPTTMKMWIATVAVIGGLAALFIGGQWIVDGASGIALKTGLSEGIVGLTIVALGNSAPDFAASVIAAIKRQPDIALGNVIGSCVFNVFLIIGLCATVRPLNAGSISLFDFSILVAGALMLWLASAAFGKRVITRGEGIALVTVYIFYMTHVIATGIT